MKISVYKYLDYKKYIVDLIENQPLSGRGERKRLADVLNCQKAFIAHVLNAEKDFNPEQVLKIGQYFNLNEAEKEYLLDLLSFNRAGTQDLKEFYKKRLSEKSEYYNLLKNRLNETQSLTIEDQAKYYSHWLYGAIHMASTIPALQSIKTISGFFNISEKDLLPMLEFLSSKGFLSTQNGKVLPDKAHIYIGQDSPLINQHHMIWRTKIMHDLQSSKPQNLHYSLCFSASQKDLPILREKLLETIEDCLKVIRPSKEEKLGLLCMDFQEL